MIEPVKLPRLTEMDELVLRLAGLVWRTAIELVEISSGRVSMGHIYRRLSRLSLAGLLRREGRFYLLTQRGRQVLRAYDLAAEAFARGVEEDS